MNTEKNISGISDNLADSIVELKNLEKEQDQSGKLYGKRIAISVSESEDLEQLGLSNHHLIDISIEIARYLIVNGATMLYGGDLRRGGFTELFSDLAYQYKYLSEKERKFVNYFSFPTSKSISIDDRVNFIKKQIEAIILEVPKHLGKINLEKKYDPFSNVEDKFILAECLTDMRKRMANESNASILVGGKEKDFIGYFPGIVEEAYHSLNIGKAIYLLGGFGGATKSIVEIISGKKPFKLTNYFQFDTDFLNAFRKFSYDKSSIKLDYDFLFNFFESYSIESISTRNGLTIEENKILFESTNIHELVFLVTKGLQNILII